MDERYAIPVESKDLAKTLILMTRSGFLIRKKGKKRGYVQISKEKDVFNPTKISLLRMG